MPYSPKELKKVRQQRKPAIFAVLATAVIEIITQISQPIVLAPYDFSFFKFLLLSPLGGFVLIAIGVIGIIRVVAVYFSVDSKFYLTRLQWNWKFTGDKRQEPWQYSFVLTSRIVTFIIMTVLGVVILYLHYR